MTPQKYNFRCKRGTTFERIVRFRDTNGDLISLAGFDVRMQVRETFDSEEPLVSVSLADTDSVVLNDDETEAFISIPASETSGLPIGRWKYDIEIESPGGTVYCPLYGSFKVYDEVTK